MTSQAVLGYLRSYLSRRQGGEDDDRELLRRFAQTREDAVFALLLQRHGPMVLGLARRVVGDWQLAEDVFQATFLLLARKVHTIRRPESLSCWLHGVAFRLALRARRSRERRREREAPVRRSHPPTPLDELTAQEFLAILDEELQALPEGYRAPLLLCCLEGLSQEAAAKRLGCSAGAVRGRLERGRNRLRRRLEKRGLMLPSVLAGSLLVTGAASAVSPALVQATLNAARTGVGATSAAAALAQEAMRGMIVNRVKAIGAAVVLFAITGSGLGMMALAAPRNRRRPHPPAPPAKPAVNAKRIDSHGDALPEGAVLRLGTIQRRAVGRNWPSARTASRSSVCAAASMSVSGTWTTDACARRASCPPSFEGCPLFLRMGGGW